MTESEPQPQHAAPVKRGFSGAQMTLVVLVAVAITAIASFFVIRTYIFPVDFEPVVLNEKEELRLDKKLQRLGWNRNRQLRETDVGGRLEPEAYSESDEDREVTLSEKEVNSLIAGDTDLARRVAIDFSDDLASAKILIPVPEDFPVMPGRILRVNTGLEIRLDSSRQPVIALKGVSVMGVPIPNAWLGNLKNVDLVGEFGDRGFWKAFADGVEDVRVRDGELYIQLRE